MQESFPALTNFKSSRAYLHATNQRRSFLIHFLGGSAQHLRYLCLASISFPAFPNLLLSASNLVYLYLCDIPSGYISPEMVADLSALTKLKVMHLCFGCPDSDSGFEDPAIPPLTRSVLPALKWLELQGGGEYPDDFGARVDVPLINDLNMCPPPIDPFSSMTSSIFPGRVEKIFRVMSCVSHFPG
jgi:hypothetical protein